MYFCCIEAMDNAVGHGHPTAVRIRVRADDTELRFEIADDGSGFDPGTVAPGIGLTGMQDRIAALGGTLRIESEPGRGTRVSGSVPLAVEASIGGRALAGAAS